MDQPPPLSDREDAILDAAFHAFAGYGYRRVTMEDIAAGAGLSRTALYQHFRNKEDIFRSLSERYFGLCLAEMERALLADGAAEDVLRAAFIAKDGKFMDVVLGTPHGANCWMPGSPSQRKSRGGPKRRWPQVWPIGCSGRGRRHGLAIRR